MQFLHFLTQQLAPKRSIKHYCTFTFLKTELLEMSDSLFYTKQQHKIEIKWALTVSERRH